MPKTTTSVQVGDELIHLESGEVARQANGAVVLRCGDTAIFASACAAKEPEANADFFPLRVDYQEKFSAVGKTMGGFVKREGRPTEKEVLVSRLIDRPLRPVFERGYHSEVQVLSYVWSYDRDHNPDVLAICASSAALTISDIPLIKPIAAVRVGQIDSQFVINPNADQRSRSRLDLVVAGTEGGLLMIEGACHFLTEDQIVAAIELAHRDIRKICAVLASWRKEVGKPKRAAKLTQAPPEMLNRAKDLALGDLQQAIQTAGKEQRADAIGAVKTHLIGALLEIYPQDLNLIKWTFSQLLSDTMRGMILKTRVRSDGRDLTEIRPIQIRQSFLPRAHGSSLFTRGETQTLAVCTLGGEAMAQRFEGLTGEGANRFYLQYAFPPYCVGETGRLGAPKRREVGHGKLAERALDPVIPLRAEFPYIVRLESNITESNGSSSMATVCGGCLAMMDAGVPVKRPVAGIAMGLIIEGEESAILSDILGVEDALGDMDFKVAGDEAGITALQMDLKVESITLSIIQRALEQAKQGRGVILAEMAKTCSKPQEQMSPFAPRIERMQVRAGKIGAIIGPGGKQIRSITEQTGVEIDIDDAAGVVCISAGDSMALAKAKTIIEGLIAEVEIGKFYQGVVKSIAPFGAFVEILPSKEGLCHISELDVRRVNAVEDICQLGDQLLVQVLDINERGQIKLSHKATKAMHRSKL